MSLPHRSLPCQRPRFNGNGPRGLPSWTCPRRLQQRQNLSSLHMLPASASHSHARLPRLRSCLPRHVYVQRPGYSGLGVPRHNQGRLCQLSPQAAEGTGVLVTEPPPESRDEEQGSLSWQDTAEGEDEGGAREPTGGALVEEGAPGTYASGQEADEAELSTGQLIWRAVKPPLYSVAFIPLLVGAALAYLERGVFFPGRFWSFLFHSVLVIAWLNLSNDAFDAETGVDKHKKESVVNITGSRVGVLVSAFALLVIGGTGLFRGALAVGDMRVFQLLAAAIFCGYIYQSPPFRLSYKGLGEPLCFIAFGPLATTAFYIFQASTPGVAVVVSPTVLASSVLVGLTTALILFCSHFHQIESDLSVGKMSPLVRLGTERGATVLTAAVASLYALTVAFCATGLLPLVSLPCLALTVPVGLGAARFVRKHHEDKATIFMAKYMCTRLHIAFGLMLSLSLALGRKLLVSA